MLTTPVISSLTLHGLPQLIRRELGERTLARAVRAAGIDLDLIEGESCFIPQAAALSLIDTAARAAGEANFGLLMAPQTDVANYGTYGHYIRASETLGSAIGRAIEALPYHSTGDKMRLAIVGEEARYSYSLALADRPNYGHAANIAAGALSSLCRHFLSNNWRPLRIELDIPRPRHTTPFEDMFRCPVVFDAPTMTVVFERRCLDARGPAAATMTPTITLADVARNRRGVAPSDPLAVALEHVRLQVRGGSISIDSTARAMGTSIRTLQRELNRQGTEFRTLVNAARAGRADELLRHTKLPITRIAAELGYSTPANFSRAFWKTTGLNPSAVRAAD